MYFQSYSITLINVYNLLIIRLLGYKDDWVLIPKTHNKLTKMNNLKK